MTLLSTLNDDMKTAMKAKDKGNVAGDSHVESIDSKRTDQKGADLNEEEELTVLSREMKQRRDSLTELRKPTAPIWLLKSQR